MRDMIDTREWAENHELLSQDLDRGVTKLMDAFRILARINYSAPWKNEKVQRCTTC